METSKKTAFLFPGQGAQYAGMAKDFVQSYAVARQTFEEADEILGRNLSKIILEGPEDLLTQTRNSQSGIFVASVAILRVLRHLFPFLEPSVCAGLSLGEYTALHASGRYGFAKTLQLVELRGQYMNEACEETPGTMAVVLGLEGCQVEDVVKEVNLPNDLWVANFNCPGQTVISGTVKGIELGTLAVKAKGAKRVLPLQVYGAFHSGLMASAERQLRPIIENVSLQESEISFVMNVPGNYVKGDDNIRSNLICQVTRPVRWEQGIRQIMENGVSNFIEIGCGRALAGFNKRIGVLGTTLNLETVEDLKFIEQDLHQL